MHKAPVELEKIRKEIDALDKMLLRTLKQRFKLVGKVAAIKKTLNLPLHQKSRWESMLVMRVKLANSLKINEAFTLALFKLIHKESKRLQALKIKKDIK
jgi:chorismate mutase